MQPIARLERALAFGAVALIWTCFAGGAGAATDTGSDGAPSQGQLESLVAPIALYPDSLLAQVLMASTYPIEVVEADRWIKDNSDLEGKALEDKLEGQSWDASVKSLTAFPQTLEMMSDKLDWTTDLGNAFLADQKQVMDSVQVLRKRAKDEGNLTSNEQQTVTVEDEPTASTTQTIIIQPAQPEVVYVPTYNPTVVYGPWPYAAYRPFYWYPPGYAFVGSAISFGVGLAVGSAMWGGCNWGRGNVDINVNRYNNFNRTNVRNSNWNHDSKHRRGAGYDNKQLNDKFGGNHSRDVKARDSFRGKAEQGRKDLARGDADKFKGRDSQAGKRASQRGESALRDGNRAQTGNRVGGQTGNRAGAQAGNRVGGQGRGSAGASNRKSSSSAFSGLGDGRETRRQSNRGSSSRASSRGGGGFSRGGGGGGGFSRGGGGGGGRRR